MFIKELRQGGHVRKFSIKKLDEAGWEVSDVEDERVLRYVHYTDWHRVERAVTVFNLLVDDLEHRGWAASR